MFAHLTELDSPPSSPGCGDEEAADAARSTEKQPEVFPSASCAVSSRTGVLAWVERGGRQLWFGHAPPLLLPFDVAVLRCVTSRDGEMLLAYSDDGCAFVVVYMTAEGMEIVAKSLAAFSTELRLILVRGCHVLLLGHRELEVWDLREASTPQLRLRRGLKTNERIAGFIDDASAFVSTQGLCSIDPGTPPEPLFHNVALDVVAPLAVSPDGRVYAASSEAAVLVRHCGAQGWQVAVPVKRFPNQVVVGNDGSLVVVSRKPDSPVTRYYSDTLRGVPVGGEEWVVDADTHVEKECFLYAAMSPAGPFVAVVATRRHVETCVRVYDVRSGVVLASAALSGSLLGSAWVSWEGDTLLMQHRFTGAYVLRMVQRKEQLVALMAPAEEDAPVSRSFTKHPTLFEPQVLRLVTSFLPVLC